jgi:hypothetical protein
MEGDHKMANKKKAASNKKKVTKHTPAAIGKLNPEFHRVLTASLAEPGEAKGSCRWTDPLGGFHCADNVTKAACDNLGGKFNPDGSC